MITLNVLFINVLVTVFQKQEVNGYHVALVEELWQPKTLPSLPPIQLVNKNAEKYVERIKQIKTNHERLDLVVFPESTLISDLSNTIEDRKAMTFVPKAEENVTPCNSTSNNKYADFFKLLSCAARKYQTYLLVNLKEKDFCEESCTKGKIDFYNTNVVFDRNGKVIARYRKFNLFLETDTKKPEIADLTTFDTDFGVKFGIFTCFDIIFKSPSIDLVRKGIRNFIFSTLWIPELPFHTTIQTQQMWAQGNNVTLLTSGGTMLPFASGGLGIFQGNQGNLKTIAYPHTDNHYLYENVQSRTFNSCSVDVNDTIARKMDLYTLYIEDLSAYNYKKLDLRKNKKLEEKLCQEYKNETFCCHFWLNVNYNEDIPKDKKIYNYFIVTRYGHRFYGNGTYKNFVEICAVVACPGSNIEDCGQRFPNYEQVSWPVTFEKMEITAEFSDTTDKMQFPNSVLADFSPLSQSCTSWETESFPHPRSTLIRTFKLRAPVSKILTFAIFGRNYALDEIIDNSFQTSV